MVPEVRPQLPSTEDRRGDALSQRGAPVQIASNQAWVNHGHLAGYGRRRHSAQQRDPPTDPPWDIGRRGPAPPCYATCPCGPAYRNRSGMRNSDGTFLQGYSGNPTGRPAVISELQKLARTHTPTALATLVEIMSNTANPPNARVSAAVALRIVVMADRRPLCLSR
jgi:hypothetical protein